MATLNLLTASYNGKLGETYGVSQYNNKYVKAIPFSHTPHNETQTLCVRAFEVLNRISSTTSKYFFPFLNLSSKKMSKHNAVAKFFKPIIADHIVNYNNFSLVFPASDTFSVSDIDFNIEQQSVSFTITNSLEQSTYEDSVYFMGVFSKLGYFKGGLVDHTSNGSYSFYLLAPYEATDILLVFRSLKRGGKYRPNSYYVNLNSLPIVQNSILYCSRFLYPSDFSYENEVLSTSPLNIAQISNEIILITQ